MKKWWKKLRKAFRTDHIVLGVLALVGILLGLTSIGKIFHLYRMMFPAEMFFAYLFSGGIILATVGVVAVLARIHRVNPFTYYFSWFIIVLTVGVEVFINAIWNTLQLNITPATATDPEVVWTALASMKHLTTLDEDTCSNIMSWVVAGVIPINAIFYFKVFSEIIIDKFGKHDDEDEVERIGVRGRMSRLWSGDKKIEDPKELLVDMAEPAQHIAQSQIEVDEPSEELRESPSDKYLIPTDEAQRTLNDKPPKIVEEGGSPFPIGSTDESPGG